MIRAHLGDLAQPFKRDRFVGVLINVVPGVLDLADGPALALLRLTPPAGPVSGLFGRSRALEEAHPAPERAPGWARRTTVNSG
jgi:hypothetical protein